MTTTPPQPMQDLPCTVQRMPEVVRVQVKDRRNPFPKTAVVQVVDFYHADEIIRRTAKHWEVTCES